MKNVHLINRLLPKFYRFVLLRSYTRHVKKKTYVHIIKYYSFSELHKFTFKYT